MASDGSLVVISARTLPGLVPASSPCGPKTTCRTSAGKPTIEKTISDCSATALGLSAHRAPLAIKGSAFDLVRLVPVMAKPRSIQWPHMLRPITPAPIQPRQVLPGASWASCIGLLSPLRTLEDFAENHCVAHILSASQEQRDVGGTLLRRHRR